MIHQEVRVITGEIMWRRRIIEIEDHVTEIEIKNFATLKNQTYTQSIMTISGVADGKKFALKTDGTMTIGDIVNEITRQVVE